MKRLLISLIIVISGLAACAQSFDEWFNDSTLRLDYIFAGSNHDQQIFFEKACSLPRWAGRKGRLADVPLKGNGQLTVKDPQTGDTLYRHSFSTLFQEWLATNEAKQTARSFENVFLVPYPKHPVVITVELRDYHDRVTTAFRHTVNPSDILIRRPAVSVTTPSQQQPHPYITLHQAADTTRCIHIAYVAEGYTQEQMPQFLDDCRAANESLFRHEPFASLQDRFNIVAVCSASNDSDVSQPGKGIWRNTALNSHFDTFYSERYLTTLHIKRLHDILRGIPYEHIIILANTSHYGGGGIYNSYNLCYTRGCHFLPVVVHEFGHSFGGLGDEYPYGDDDPMYFSDTEPWEPNLTTHPAQPKWQSLIDAGQASVIEGGGYLSKGVWRSQENCRMRTNEHPDFCPVCQQALRRLIDFYTR